MKLLNAFLVIALLATSAPVAFSQNPRQQALQRIVDAAALETIASFAAKGFTRENLAVTLVDLNDPANLVEASFRGDVPIYPASVVKMFYMVAVHRWLEDAKIGESEELNRALRDMIVDSSNDATHYVVDVLTGTTAGPELPAAAAAEWGEKRNSINRYFASLGYRNINVNQKTWCEGPYGREKAFVGPNRENRNKLTTEATARLMTEIVLGRAVSPKRSGLMMELMKRDPFAGNDKDPDNQARGFTGIALKEGTRLWSKAGWTSTTRHDAAYIEIPKSKLRFVLVTFTTDHSQEREIIPSVARKIIGELEK